MAYSADAVVVLETSTLFDFSLRFCVRLALDSRPPTVGIDNMLKSAKKSCLGDVVAALQDLHEEDVLGCKRFGPLPEGACRPLPALLLPQHSAHNRRDLTLQLLLEIKISVTFPAVLGTST